MRDVLDDHDVARRIPGRWPVRCDSERGSPGRRARALGLPGSDHIGGGRALGGCAAIGCAHPRGPTLAHRSDIAVCNVGARAADRALDGPSRRGRATVRACRPPHPAGRRDRAGWGRGRPRGRAPLFLRRTARDLAPPRRARLQLSRRPDGIADPRPTDPRADPRPGHPAGMDGRLDLPVSDGPPPGDRPRRQGSQAIPLSRALADGPRRRQVRATHRFRARPAAGPRSGAMPTSPRRACRARRSWPRSSGSSR